MFAVAARQCEPVLCFVWQADKSNRGIPVGQMCMGNRQGFIEIPMYASLKLDGLSRSSWELRSELRQSCFNGIRKFGKTEVALLSGMSGTEISARNRLAVHRGEAQGAGGVRTHGSTQYGLSSFAAAYRQVGVRISIRDKFISE